MKYKFKIITLIFTAITSLCFFSSVDAAVLSLMPTSSEIGVGEKIILELRVDSEGVSFNASQVVIRFPKDILEVISIDKKNSPFGFWLEEPQFSNTEGVVSFTGGTSFGISGGAVGILKIEFQAKGIGSGALSLTEAAITASDGSGTNILSKTNDAIISVIPKRVTPKLSVVEQVIRKAVSSDKLPLGPILKIALYPREDRWYNLVAQFTASWGLPPDVFGVSTVLNKSPNSIPSDQSEGLFENKTFDALGDGVWYLHVHFKNNVGWGPVAHYKIAIDTKPPIGFEANVIEGEKTDNPTPTFKFQTSDSLSGLKEYQIRIDYNDFILINAKDFLGSFKLPLQTPGKKKILVRAVDFAENSIENSVDLEILPIASPDITFIQTEFFLEDKQDLTVKGRASPDFNVLLKLKKVLSKAKEEIVAETVVHPDEKGNWEFTFGSQLLRNGKYVVLVKSQDVRGALSLEIKSQEIQVKSKPIMQIGSFQLGIGGVISFLLLILVGSFGGGVWFYRKRQEKLILRVGFAESEITKIFKIVSEDVDKLSSSLQTATPSDNEYAVKRLKENIIKMEAYLKKGIEKIKR